MTARGETVMGETCPTCNAPFASVPDDMAAELNLKSQVCLCDARVVHDALTAEGFAPLDNGWPMGGPPPADDSALREGGWPIIPALGYERGDHDVRWSNTDDLPPWARVELAYAFVRYYANAWAVLVARTLVAQRGERIRQRCVKVLQRGAADPEFRAATHAAYRIGGNDAFAAALMQRPRR